MKKLEFKIFPITGMILYVPFHVVEEAIGNFPLWIFHEDLPQEPTTQPLWVSELMKNYW